MAKKLENINFSSGIRAEKIQYNFDALEEQLARERLAIAGHGISTGFEMSIEGFSIHIESGSLIGNNGKEIFLDAKTIEIERPRLKQEINKSVTVEEGGTITLGEIPYCLHRESAVLINSLQSGLTIVNANNINQTIKLRNIRDNILTIDSSYAGSVVKVSYSYTYKRYDTIYIDLNGEIKILEGTSSSSPSTILPEDSMYLIGYVEIDPFSLDEKNNKVSVLKIKKDMRNLRNLFTDNSNRLFICGVPFDNLQIIHMEQPTEPLINQLWYDGAANKLKVWKELDNIEQWTNVNDTSTIPVEEVKMWLPEQNPVDGKYFIFSQQEIQYHFVPNRNCLDIRIDQGILHKDQFDEVTLAEAKTNKVLRDFLINSHGYTEEFINQINEVYENIGIGFVLGSPLDKGCYVEALVHHRVHENPLSKRFQRTATFVARNYFRIDSNAKLFEIKEYFRFGENQLELFLDGRRLELGIDYVEGNDALYRYDQYQTLIEPKQGQALKHFLIKRDLPQNAILSYQITTNIYSYDHVEQLIENLSQQVLSAEMTVDLTQVEMTSIKEEVNQKIEAVTLDMATLKEQNAEHADFIRTTDTINVTNLSSDILGQLQKGFINKTFTKTASQIIPLQGITPKDFIIAFDMSKQTGNNILKRIENDNPQGEGDYYIESLVSNEMKTNASGSYYTEPVTQVNMHFKSASTVDIGSSVYITGIKF